MNWFQENKKLAGIASITVAGAVGLGAWLFMAWSAYSESMEKWDTTQARIATIKGKKLEPTEANVAAREKLLTEYAEKVNDLRSALLSVQQKYPVKPMSETEFQSKLKDRATEAKRLVKNSGATPLPDDFAFGFDKYAALPPRSAEIAAELNIHLDVIEKVVTTCIEAGVDSIDMVERTKLPNEDAPAPPKAAPVTSKSKSTAKNTKAKKPLITEQAAAEPVLDRYPIKLMITTDQAQLQTVLNTLCNPSKMPYFLVVRQLRIENSRLDGPTKEEVNSKRTAAATAASNGLEPVKPTTPPAPDAPQVIAAAKPAAPDAFDIMGNERLKVYMEIDYIRFRPAPEIEEEEAAAPASKS